VAALASVHVHLRHGRRRSTRCRHPRDGRTFRWRKENHIVATPRPWPKRPVADRQWRATGRIDFLELSIREEPDVAAVWRPERKKGTFGASDRLRRRAVQRSHPQHHATACILSTEGQAAAVRGEGHSSENRANSVSRRHERAPIHVGVNGWPPKINRRSEPHCSQQQKRGRRDPPIRPRLGNREDRRSDSRQMSALRCSRQHSSLRAGGGSPLQLVQQIVSCLPAVVGILRQTLLDEAIECWWSEREA
jgi:hypothetical protein